LRNIVKADGRADGRAVYLREEGVDIVRSRGLG
jgi:hypothetical protein